MGNYWVYALEIMPWLWLCKQANICMSVLLQFEKKYTWSWGKILCIFHFSHLLFYENINQEHNLLPDCAFGPFTYGCCKNCMSGFSAFVLNFSKSGNIFFRKMPIGNCRLSIIVIGLVGEINHWCMNFVWVMAAFELHVNGTYAQYPALKSVYGKDQSRFQNKWLELLLSIYEALVQKDASIIKTGYLHHFYVLFYYHHF